ncbi:MAG: UDP-galactopyranose mutase [Ferruginibacter sp.]
MSKFSKTYRTFYFEEPEYTNEPDGYTINLNKDHVWIVVPHLQVNQTNSDTTERTREILDSLMEDLNINDSINWYYTPMALAFSSHLKPKLTVYDCMDELSAFKYAPPQLKAMEKQLMERADIVFTGGHSIYEAKKDQHENIHPFPSSIDKAHFGLARHILTEQEDQKNIPHPRFGFFGVIDERFDIELVRGAAEQKPDWQFILIGPVVKIDPQTLPKFPNIHYLGGKDYKDLPQYLAGWDVAIMPFAINESTRYISPTKTPEYLAGGKPVIATGINDVIKPYGVENLVHIVKDSAEFIAAGELELNNNDKKEWQTKVDSFIKNDSWDNTWLQMMQLIDITLKNSQNKLSSNTLKRKPVFDYLIVGAGFAGSVIAERLASQLNKKVLIIDKRDHIAGNAFDFYDKDGILVHKYGPHIFHTNSEDVFNYLGKFTSWRPYEHEVLTNVEGKLVPIPINLNTINQLYDLDLNSDQLEAFFEERAEKKSRIKTSEDVVVSKVGRDLYEKFFRGYTRKMWNLDPSELDASVTARVPTRTDKDNRYFTDTYQAMPAHGYTQMFSKMLSHPNIKIMLNTDYKEIMDMIPYKELIFTGPIDEYFNYCYGKLPYRSLDFKFETLDQANFQSKGTINFPNEHAYTRITEFKFLTGQEHNKTSIVYEFPKDGGDPYYPIPRPENGELYKKYLCLADSMANTYFTGRLATYKYYNMDQVVAQSLTLFKKLSQRGSVQTINEPLVENRIDIERKKMNLGAA